MFRWSHYSDMPLLCCLIFHASYTESLQVKLNCPCSTTSLNEKNLPGASWRCHAESQVPLTLWEWIHIMISYWFAEIAWSVEEIKRSVWILPVVQLLRITVRRAKRQRTFNARLGENPGPCGFQGGSRCKLQSPKPYNYSPAECMVGFRVSNLHREPRLELA